VFLPNKHEAISLSGEAEVELAAHRLGERIETLAVKLGEDGALGVRSGQTIQSGSIPVNTVDTVGAGDSFDAGFLYGYLHNWELKQTLQLACACGALSTQKPGGTEGQPTWDEAMVYVS